MSDPKCEVVENEVLNKKFHYCKTHKVETNVWGCAPVEEIEEAAIASMKNYAIDTEGSTDKLRNELKAGQWKSPAVKVHGLWPTSVGEITPITMGEFLSKVEVKIVDTSVVLFSRRVRSVQDPTCLMRDTSWVRDSIVLNRPVEWPARPWDFISSLKFSELNLYDKTLQGVIEQGCLESAYDMGSPTYAVFEPTTFGLLILNPKDFRTFMHFDKGGVLRMNVACLNFETNLRIHGDWSKIKGWTGCDENPGWSIDE